MRLSLIRATVFILFVGSLNGSVRADETTKLVQPQLGFDDVGFAVCKEGKLYLRTFEWQSNSERKEVDHYEVKVQTRSMKKHQLNPKTGRQELVDFEYEIEVPIRLGKKEVTTIVRGSTSENKAEFPLGKYSVFTLDGKTLTAEETAKQLATERTVLVVKQRYWTEPFPKFEDSFRALMHPRTLIIRIRASSRDKASLKQE